MMSVAPLASPGPLDLLFRRRSSLGLTVALLNGAAGASSGSSGSLPSNPTTPTPWDLLQRRRSSLGLSSLFERAVPNGMNGSGGATWAEGLFDELQEGASPTPSGTSSPVQMVPSADDERMVGCSGQPLLEALISDPMFMSGQSLSSTSKPEVTITAAAATATTATSTPPQTPTSSPTSGLSVKIEPYRGAMLAPQSTSSTTSSTFYTPAASPEPAGPMNDDDEGCRGLMSAGLSSDRKRRFDEFDSEDDEADKNDVDDDVDVNSNATSDLDSDSDSEADEEDAFSTSYYSSRSSRAASPEPAWTPSAPLKAPKSAKASPPSNPKSAKKRRRAVPTSAAVLAAMPKPPRRGRKDKTIEERCKGMSPEQARLEKNRQSAKECRLRKKEYVGNLENKVAEFEERERLRSKELEAVQAQLAALQRQYDAIEK